MTETVTAGDGVYLYPTLWLPWPMLQVRDFWVEDLTWAYLTSPLMVVRWERLETR